MRALRRAAQVDDAARATPELLLRLRVLQLVAADGEEARLPASQRAGRLLQQHALARLCFASSSATSSSSSSSTKNDGESAGDSDSSTPSNKTKKRRQTLWDCVPVAKLQSWASDCRERHESLRNEPAIELERTYKEVLRSVQDDILSKKSQPSIAVLQHRLEIQKLQQNVTSTMGTSNNMMNAIRSIVQTFENDYDWIKNVVLSGIGVSSDRGSASALAKEAIDRGDSHFALLREVRQLTGGDKLTEEEEESEGSGGGHGEGRSQEQMVQWSHIFEQCTTLENSCRRKFLFSVFVLYIQLFMLCQSLSAFCSTYLEFFSLLIVCLTD